MPAWSPLVTRMFDEPGFVLYLGWSALNELSVGGVPAEWQPVHFGSTSGLIIALKLCPPPVPLFMSIPDPPSGPPPSGTSPTEQAPSNTSSANLARTYITRATCKCRHNFGHVISTA